MKRIITLMFAIVITHLVTAQESDKKRDFRRFSYRLSTGINSFSTSGIQKSRNQINFEAAGNSQRSEYLQESRIVGLAFEAGAHYHFTRKLRLGIAINAFRDDDEYFGTSDKRVTPDRIERDSLNTLSVMNMQAYVTLGLSVEYDLFHSKDSKHKLSAGFSGGRTFNRTPNRTEYDVFADNNFLPAGISSEYDWYITHTSFNNGWYVMPSAVYQRALNKRHALHASFSMGFHWLSSSYELQLLDRVSSGRLPAENYTLRAVQIKIGYTFN